MRISDWSSDVCSSDLAENCGRYGLIVAGYSGRDESVMAVFDEALAAPTPFPNGFFWLHRGADPPLPQVTDLLARAVGAGLEAAPIGRASCRERVGKYV